MYMAPELTNDCLVFKDGAAVDMYAFGCTMIVLKFRQLPSMTLRGINTDDIENRLIMTLKNMEPQMRPTSRQLMNEYSYIFNIK